MRAKVRLGARSIRLVKAGVASVCVKGAGGGVSGRAPWAVVGVAEDRESRCCLRVARLGGWGLPHGAGIAQVPG